LLFRWGKSKVDPIDPPSDDLRQVGDPERRGGSPSIACAQLAGNALGRIVPGSAPPFTVVMLRKARVDGGEAAAALTASTGLQITMSERLPRRGGCCRSGSEMWEAGQANSVLAGPDVQRWVDSGE
jgi:hypothetical protein